MTSNNYFLTIPVIFSLIFYSCNKPSGEQTSSGDSNQVKIAAVTTETPDSLKLDPNDPAYEEKKAGQMAMAAMVHEWVSIEYDYQNKPYVQNYCNMDTPEMRLYQKDGFTILSHLIGDASQEYSIAEFIQLPKDENNNSVADLTLGYVGAKGIKHVKVIYNDTLSKWTGFEPGSVYHFAEKKISTSYPHIDQECGD